MSQRSVGRDRTHRRPSRIRQAFEETLSENVAQALEGNRGAEKILIGHKREMDRLNRESARESTDLDRDLAATDKLLSSENEGLNLLKKRKDRMEASTPPQPTEIVEGQIVESSRRVFQLQEQQNKLRQRKSRLEQDTARERQQELEDVSRRLKEAQ